MSNDFKQRLAQPRIVLAPGIYDALSALIAQQSGFEALYLSGGSVAYTLLGQFSVQINMQDVSDDALELAAGGALGGCPSIDSCIPKLCPC
jgi:2-methylisocitrate lyase-like PEP mutase family enzyme